HQPRRHVQRDLPGIRRHRAAGAGRRRRPRGDRQHGQRRRVRRADRPAGVLRLQGRRARHDPPDRPRARPPRHPGVHHRPRHHGDADARRSPAGRAGLARPAGAVPVAPRQARRVRGTGGAHRRQRLPQRRDHPPRRRHPHGPEVNRPSEEIIMSLSGKTILMSGGSRGIGLAIALRAAADGANIAMLAKTDTPHPKLEGTVHTAADAIREAGGKALPIVGDVRNDSDITAAVLKAQGEFGGIDIVINNASVVDLSRSTDLEAKKYDLMQDVNVRGTFMLSRAAVPLLREAENPHILSLSPPLNISPKWLGAHTGYTLAKYGMTMVTLGLAAE